MGQHHADQQDGMTGPEEQDGGKPVGPLQPGVIAISEILTGLFEFFAISGKARVLGKTASYIRCLQGKQVIVEAGKRGGTNNPVPGISGTAEKTVEETAHL